MTFLDIVPDLRANMPELRGRLSANEQLAPFTWFRVGGPAQVLFQPADEEDLSYFLSRLSADIPVLVVGLGSNLIVRDGGVPGVVIRLGGKAFADIVVEDGHRLRVGAAAPDRFVAKRAAELGVAGLEFLSGIPGAIGGALRMNAGAHGGETKDVLILARGVERSGETIEITNAGSTFEALSIAAMVDSFPRIGLVEPVPVRFDTDWLALSEDEGFADHLAIFALNLEYLWAMNQRLDSATQDLLAAIDERHPE